MATYSGWDFSACEGSAESWRLRWASSGPWKSWPAHPFLCPSACCLRAGPHRRLLQLEVFDNVQWQGVLAEAREPMISMCRSCPDAPMGAQWGLGCADNWLGCGLACMLLGSMAGGPGQHRKDTWQESTTCSGNGYFKMDTAEEQIL